MSQRTFGKLVEMKPIVPSTWHYMDQVECSDGSILRRSEVLVDCDGGFHATDEARHEANVEVVTDILEDRIKYANEYATENEDYATSFPWGEHHHNWAGPVEDWVECNDVDFTEILASAFENDEFKLPGYEDFEPGPDEYAYDDVREYLRDNALLPSISKIVDFITNGLTDCDGDVEYDSSEWNSYEGSGCSLDAFNIDECEEQVEINTCEALKELHDSGELDDVLDDVDLDEGGFNRTKKRVKNEKTGKYEFKGRETYDPYDSEYPDLTLWHSPGGQWMWVIDGEQMEDLLKEALVENTEYSE